ncbi:MAG: zinc ribbon domain-containing protein [Nitrospirota bacterium]|nr:zinc ribbon domain-containing protein [Nitrospirota bacterium]
MPLYEYRCEPCGDEFTLLQPMSVRPGDTTCPACGGREVARRMSVFAPSVPSGPASAQGGCGPMGGCGIPQSGCGSGGCGL